MKKIILLSILLCLGYVLNAQTNLISNPGFEDAGVVIKKQTTDLLTAQNARKWVHLLKAASNEGTVSIVTDEKYEGNNSLEINLQSIAQRYNFYIAYEFVNLKPAKYTYSFYVKAEKTNTLRIEAEGVMGAGVKIDADKRFLIGTNQNGVAFDVSTTWQKYSVEMDLTAYTPEQIKYVNLILRPNCNFNGTVNNVANTYWFDNFEFVGDESVEPADNFEVLMNTISNRYEQDYSIASLNTRVDRHLALINVGGEFSDINYGDKSDTNWEPIAHLDRVADFIFAYTLPGTKYFEKEDTYNKIVSSLETWYAKKPVSSNWWQNQIAVPKSLGLSLIQMRRGWKQIDPALETKLINRMAMDAESLNDADLTGANLTDVATDYFYRACLTKDETALNASITAAYKPLGIVTSGNEGIQVDYSFQQHGPQLYIGGYGDELIKGVTNFALNTVGTTYALKGDQLKVLSQFVRGTYLTSLRGRTIHYNAIGRSVSRANAIVKTGMSKQIESMLTLDPLNSSEYADALKRMKGEETASYKVVEQNIFYPQSDYVIHNRANYSFSVRGVSERTSMIENGNKENLLSYFMTYGSTVMMQDGNEYTDIFPVWNWTRIPGVTNPQVSTIPLRRAWSALGTEKFVGGVSNKEYAVMAYSHKDETGGKETRAQKSWFMFDDEVVALGAGIASTANETVNTTLEQASLSGNVTVLNNSTEAKVNKGDEKTYDQTATWVHHNNTGYLFPKGGKVSVSNLTQKGNWYTINNAQVNSEVQKDVFTLYFDHGIAPSNGSYAYIIVPNTSVAELKAYNVSNIKIVENTSDIQAVVNKKLNVFQAVFYKAGKVEYEGLIIEVDKPSVVMLNNFKSAKAELTVADPSHSKAKVTVKVTFANTSGEPVEQVADFSGESVETAGTSKVFEVEVPAKVVYGKNLIQNPSFEEDVNLPQNLTIHPTSGQYTDRWNLTVTTGNGDEGNVSVVSDVAQHESNSMKVTLEDITARYRFYMNYDVVDAAPGVYEFSFYAKADVADIPFRVEVMSYDAKGKAYNAGIDLLYNADNKLGVEEKTKTDWVKYTYTLDLSTKTAAEIKVLRLHIRPNCLLNGNITKTKTNYWFDNFFFQEVMDGKEIESFEIGEILKNGLEFVENTSNYDLTDPMHFTINPKGAYMEDVVYNVDNTGVIEINEGIVTVKSKGVANVFLSSAKDASIKSETFKVTVKEKPGLDLRSITLTSTLKNGLKFQSSTSGHFLIEGSNLIPIGNSGYTVHDKLILDPIDYPLGDMRYKSETPNVATINDDGIIVFGTEMGKTKITISSGIKPGIVSESFEIIVQKSADANVHSLKINNYIATPIEISEGGVTKTVYSHSLNCGDVRDIQVEFETEEDATVDIERSFVIKFGTTPKDEIITFAVKAANTTTSKTYEVRLYSHNYYVFDEIIKQKFNNRLIVNNNKQTNGNLTFKKYFWIVDGVEQAEGSQIYKTPSNTLSTSSIYAARLVTTDPETKADIDIKVCPSTIELKKSASISVYPNPVAAGEMFTVTATMPTGADYSNSQVHIYSMSGNVVETAKLSGEETQLIAPATAGMYVVKVLCDGHTSEFKILVK